MTRDPLGEEGGINLYDFVGNNLVNFTDLLGLFDDGRSATGSGPSGHSDFYGSGYFDFTSEDHGATSPYNQPERHFRDLSASESDVAAAIATCNKDAFERAMHRGQDYFSHYKKGYRWDPGNSNLRCNGWGHACKGGVPDNDSAAWWEANAWTRRWVKEYEKKCLCQK
jgi:hypothetical protein